MALKMQKSTSFSPVKQGLYGNQMVNYEEHLMAKEIVGNVVAEKLEKSGNGEKKTLPLTNEQVVLNPGVLVSKPGHFSVMVEGGRTITDGNFGSYRVTVGLTIPCDADNLNAAYEFGTSWVSEKIEEALKEAKGY